MYACLTYFLLLKINLLEDQHVIVRGHVAHLPQLQVGLVLSHGHNVIDLAQAPRGIAALQRLVKLVTRKEETGVNKCMKHKHDQGC